MQAARFVGSPPEQPGEGAILCGQVTGRAVESPGELWEHHLSFLAHAQQQRSSHGLCPSGEGKLVSDCRTGRCFTTSPLGRCYGLNGLDILGCKQH